MPKAIPLKPRINRAQEIARGLLLAHKVSSFPVDVISIIKNTGICILKKYSKQAIKHNLPFEYFCENFGKDGATLYKAGKKKPYTILYNDLRQPFTRVRWTLAHELGHVILRHSEEFEETKLIRNGLTDESYKVLDDEADAFAAELLSPVIVLIAAGWTSKSDIMTHCLLSNDAAKYRSKSVLGVKKVKEFYFIHEQRLFKSFYNHIYLNYCPECKIYFVSKEAKYCPICGANHLIWKKGEPNIMYYPGIKVDENSKAVKCPHCDNEEILEKGEYCIICGTMLVNKCLRRAESENGYIEYYDGCGKLLPGNARYCPYCGGESSFFVNGLLSSWEAYQKQDAQESFGSKTTTKAAPQLTVEEIEEIPF